MLIELPPVDTTERDKQIYILNPAFLPWSHIHAHLSSVYSSSAVNLSLKQYAMQFLRREVGICVSSGCSHKNDKHNQIQKHHSLYRINICMALLWENRVLNVHCTPFQCQLEFVCYEFIPLRCGKAAGCCSYHSQSAQWGYPTMQPSQSAKFG